MVRLATPSIEGLFILPSAHFHHAALPNINPTRSSKKANPIYRCLLLLISLMVLM